MPELPPPEAVPDRAREAAGEGGDPPNLLVVPEGGPDPGGVEQAADGTAYEGPDAGAMGRLAAAAAACESTGARLHYPEADATAPGPWLVVEPLGGLLSTVHAGRGRATVRCALPAPADRPAATGERVEALCASARPEHDHYPVGRDEVGLFRTGMTTFSLAGVEVGDRLTVRFDVATTPATAASAVEERFGAHPWVESVSYEQVVGVERATPPDRLRRAAEAAAVETVGDWEYDWFPEPTAFSHLPTGDEVALGTGLPGADRFDGEQFERCRALLERAIAGWRER